MIFEIVKLTNFQNFTFWKINNLVEFFKFRKPKFGSKNLPILELLVY